MVDTINPQTGKPDSDNTGGNSASFGQNNFYSGFGKPDDLHVNLANEGAPASNIDAVSASLPN